MLTALDVNIFFFKLSEANKKMDKQKVMQNRASSTQELLVEAVSIGLPENVISALKDGEFLPVYRYILDQGKEAPDSLRRMAENFLVEHGNDREILLYFMNIPLLDYEKFEDFILSWAESQTLFQFAVKFQDRINIERFQPVLLDRLPSVYLYKSFLSLPGIDKRLFIERLLAMDEPDPEVLFMVAKSRHITAADRDRFLQKIEICGDEKVRKKAKIFMAILAHAEGIDRRLVEASETFDKVQDDILKYGHGRDGYTLAKYFKGKADIKKCLLAVVEKGTPRTALDFALNIEGIDDEGFGLLREKIKSSSDMNLIAKFEEAFPSSTYFSLSCSR